MEPLTMALIAGGATALGGIPSAFAPRRTEKAQKKRLKELERMEEMGALGLTEQQRTSARQELQAPSIQAQQRADAEMRRLATANAQPGQQLQQASLAAQNRAATEAQIASSILGLDLEEQAKQQQEMKNLRGVLDERRIEKVDALTKPITEGATAYIQADTLETLFNQQPAERIESLSKETSLPPSAIKRSFPILNEVSDPRIIPDVSDLRIIPDVSDPRILPQNTNSLINSNLSTFATQNDIARYNRLKEQLQGRVSDEELLRIFQSFRG